MPELPEVEVVRLSLRPRLLDRQLGIVTTRAPALREPLDHAALGGLAGARVLELRRRAKYLLIDVEDDRTLVVHLGMSGRFTVVPPDEALAKHEHLSIALGDGYRLRLVDPRRFGQAMVLSTSVLDTSRYFAHLGVEPLDDTFDGRHLARMAKKRRGPIKTFLMDQRVVVGVGNIYASEALWRSRVHPKRSVARVSNATWQRVAEAARETLADAIREGGTTLNDFADGEGNAGYFQVSLKAYGRDGAPCVRCQTPMRRIVQANRSTFYCPRCQR